MVVFTVVVTSMASVVPRLDVVAVEAAASTGVFSKTFANHCPYRLDRFSVLELVNPGRRQTHASSIRRSISVMRAGQISHLILFSKLCQLYIFSISISKTGYFSPDKSKMPINQKIFFSVSLLKITATSFQIPAGVAKVWRRSLVVVGIGRG